MEFRTLSPDHRAQRAGLTCTIWTVQRRQKLFGVGVTAFACSPTRLKTQRRTHGQADCVHVLSPIVATPGYPLLLASLPTLTSLSRTDILHHLHEDRPPRLPPHLWVTHRCVLRRAFHRNCKRHLVRAVHSALRLQVVKDPRRVGSPLRCHLPTSAHLIT